MNPCLRVLRLSQMNLSDTKQMNLIVYIIRANNNLIDLELSWGYLFPICNLYSNLTVYRVGDDK